jgi:hypothetical protein
MIQRGEDFGFTLKASRALRVSGDGLGEHFQSDVTVQTGIDSAVDLPHPTRTYQRDDFVSAN